MTLGAYPGFYLFNRTNSLDASGTSGLVIDTTFDASRFTRK